MEIWLFGNPDLAEDALPLLLKDQLEAAFPSAIFIEMDPLDEWEHTPDPLIIIDTIKGIDTVSVFDSLEHFQQAPALTMHDFDLLTQLAFLKKLGKLPKLTIIGIPSQLTEDEAFMQTAIALRPLLA